VRRGLEEKNRGLFGVANERGGGGLGRRSICNTENLPFTAPIAGIGGGAGWEKRKERD